MLELFNILNSLNWICQFQSTGIFLGVSGVCLKKFKIPIYGFILVALSRTLCHTYYFHNSVKFPGKDFLEQYTSDFYRRSENSKWPEIQKLWKKWHHDSRTLAKRDSSLCSGDVSLQLFYPIPLFPPTGSIVSRF